MDTFAPFGYGLQPQLPFALAAFRQRVAHVERGFLPLGARSAAVAAILEFAAIVGMTDPESAGPKGA